MSSLNSNNFFFSIKNADALIKLIIVNVFLFVALKLLNAFFTLFNISNPGFLQWLAVPASLDSLIARPWTLITYLFTHENFFHILFNMLWLYWLGKIFLEYLGNRKLLAVYLLGGISGAFLYILAFNTFPAFKTILPFSYAIGASAGILAIVIATATLLPDYKISLLFFGNISLKYIAAFSVLLDLINISESNAGGHIAHLGGALFGFVYIKQLQKGINLSKWLEFLPKSFMRFSSFKSKMKVVHKRPITDEEFLANKKQRQEVIDQILDKIAKSGYDSLSKKEKEILFKVSKNN